MTLGGMLSRRLLPIQGTIFLKGLEGEVDSFGAAVDGKYGKDAAIDL